MNEREAKERILLGADSRTEFKSENAANEALAVAMISFANAQGGQLFLGVENDGTITGVVEPDKLLQRVDNIARHNIHPPIWISATKMQIDEKRILVVDIPRGPQRPYCTNDGRHFIRTASGHRIATRQDLLLLFQSAGSLLADEIPVGEAEIADLDEPYLMNFIERDNPTVAEEIKTGNLLRENVLASMKVIREGHPTIVGLNCFGKEPAKHVPYFRISATRFKGIEISEEVLSSRDYGEKIEEQFRGVEEFVKAYLPAPSRIEGFESELPRTIPDTAIREALVNAFAHRDYMIPSQIRLFIFDDRLEVISPGKLLNTVSVESMRVGIHVPRNPLILTFLGKMGLASNRGTGAPRIFRLMKEAGLPEPEILQIGSDLKVVLRSKRPV